MKWNNSLMYNLVMQTIKKRILELYLDQLIYIYIQFTMKYLAAYALIALSGKKDINAADIKGVLAAASAKAEDADINRLLEAVKGKKIEDLIAEGSKKIGSASAPTEAKAPVAKEEPKKKEQPKKKEKPAPPPEDDDDDFMAGGLFD